MDSIHTIRNLESLLVLLDYQLLDNKIFERERYLNKIAEHLSHFEKFETFSWLISRQKPKIITIQNHFFMDSPLKPCTLDHYQATHIQALKWTNKRINKMRKKQRRLAPTDVNVVIVDDENQPSIKELGDIEF